MKRQLTIIGVIIALVWAVVPALAQDGLVRTDAPSTAVVLALDTSQSMSGAPMASTRETAAQFVNDVSGAFPVAVTTFSSEVTIRQTLTTDEASLTNAIEQIRIDGRTALYDGSVEAIKLAADANVQQPIVVLVSDGAEYGGLSEATRDDAAALANAQGVTVYTVGIGFGIDRSYLQELATVSGGTFYELESPAVLAETFTTIYDNIQANLPAQPLANAQEAANMPIAPLGDEVQPQPITDTARTEPAAAPISPLLSNVLTLDNSADSRAKVPGEGVPDTVAALPATGDGGVETSQAAADSASEPISPDNLQPQAQAPLTNNAYITLQTGETAYEQVEMTLNGVELKTFYELPYDYTLNTDLLSAGTYRLTFNFLTENGLSISDDLMFDLAISETDTGEEMRRVLVEGEARPLELRFNMDDGLTFTPQAVQQASTVRNLGDILMQPLQFVPEPVKDTLTRQYPTAVIVLVVIMTVVLLPQGIFTIYWMTYTWVHPSRFEKSGAPKQHEVPRYSFTALVPARKEEAVIYDTIMTVNGIDYPEDLKETLILVRDEDDDATIEKTMAAIADIKAGYEERGEEYPDNVHLITFTDGPKNKPNGLNRGYRVASKEVICIFDAEDQPHEQIYNAVNSKMISDGADVVQSGVQLMNFRTNWFSGFNVLEYFFWFKSGLHAYTEGLNVTPLGGNTVFFKKEWLDILAAEDTEKGYRVWNENRLTEDADIGLRLTSMGASIQIMYDAELATREETPGSIPEFIKQRTRWCQGFYEIFMDGYWMDLPTLKQRIASIYILLNSLLQALILVFLPIGIYIGFFQQVPVPVALLSWLPVFLLLTQLVLTLIGIREFTQLYNKKLPLFFRWRMVLFYYPYQLLLAVAAVRAIYRFVTNQSAWEKTAHSNLHRQAQAH